MYQPQHLRPGAPRRTRRIAASIALSFAALAASVSPAAADTASDAGVYAYGTAASHGALTGDQARLAVVGMAPTKSGHGYWLVASDGGVFSYGDAAFFGSMGGHALNKPIVGIAATKTGNGYWLVASDGGIFAFGDAGFYGSAGALSLQSPVVGITASKSGRGYLLVAADGGVFAYGDAAFEGSMGSVKLNQPVVGIAPSKTGNGYVLVASDGGVFAFGDAGFYGSAGGLKLNDPIVSVAATSAGYLLAARDGGVFAYGDAHFYGSPAGTDLTRPVVGIASTPDGNGYWLVQGSSHNPITTDLISYLQSRSARVSVAVYDNITGQTSVYRPDDTYYCASVVKLNIMETAFHNGASSGQRSLMVPMITQSDNDAANDLWNSVGGAGSVLSYDRSIGMTNTSDPSYAWGLTRTSAADQALLMRQLAYPSSLSNSDRAYGIGLMQSVTASQRWGVTAGTSGAQVAVKNGWLPYNGKWLVNSVGWVHGNGRDYTIAVMTEGTSEQYQIDTIQGASARIYSALS